MAKISVICKHLEKLKIDFAIVDFVSSPYTVDDVRKAGISESSIVKTLIIRNSGGFAALVLRGSDRVDFSRLKKILKGPAEFAKPNEVVKVAGVPVGAVCPIAIGVPLYVDSKVFSISKLHLGSGDLKKGLEIGKKGFLDAIENFEICEFSK